jgi:hypothetical protein
MRQQVIVSILWVLAAATLLVAGPSVHAQNAIEGTQATPEPSGAPTPKTFTDNYSDPAHELLPTASGAGVQAQYVGGEYQIALSDQSTSVFETAGAPDPFTDVAITVDARVVGNPTSQQVAVGCRLLPVGPSKNNGYWFVVLPSTSSVALLRAEAGQRTPIVDIQPASAVHSGNETNHIELDCTGSTITASVNGTQVLSTQESMYSVGFSSLGTGPAIPNVPSVASDVRWSSLSTTGTQPLSGTAVVSDSLMDAATGVLPPTFSGAGYQGGYVQGEYQVQKVDPAATNTASQEIPVNYADVTIAVDTHLASLDQNSNSGQEVLLACRLVHPDGMTANGYRLYFAPATGSWSLARVDPTSTVPLSTGQMSDSTASSPHHLQLTCSGSTIAASVDQMQLVSVQDSTYTVGKPAIGAAVDASSLPGTIDARFSDLVLSQP